MELRELQDEFQNLLLEYPEKNFSKAFNLSPLKNLICHGSHISNNEIFNIYRRMIPLRLTEALEADFPCCAFLLGEEAFARYCREYMALFPSRSYTLDDFGSWFSEFLKGRIDLAFGELASFEWELSRLFDQKEPSLPDSRKLAEKGPEFWLRAKFLFAPTCSIYVGNFNIPEVYEAFRNDEKVLIKEKKSRLLLSIRDSRLYRTPVSSDQLFMLRLLREGKSLACILDHETLPDLDPGTLLKDFSTWTSLKVFQEIVARTLPEH